jgi:hypothetical protein
MKIQNRHIWLMVLCCLIPVALLGGALLLGVPVTSALAFALVLLCPLSHLLFMRQMGHTHETGQDRDTLAPAASSPLPAEKARDTESSS